MTISITVNNKQMTIEFPDLNHFKDFHVSCTSRNVIVNKNKFISKNDDL